jgi:protein SCO1/2
MVFCACSSTGNNHVEKSNDHTKLVKQKEKKGLSIFQLPSVWQSQDSSLIKWADLKGNVLVVVMIYTSCKTACPRLIADMKDLKSRVSASENAPIRYVLVSIDPEVDTPNRLKKFSIQNKMTDKQWLFLRGNENDTRIFANVLSMKYARISPMDFSHSNIISVFNKNGVLEHQMEGLAVNNQQTLETIQALLKNNHP